MTMYDKDMFLGSINFSGASRQAVVSSEILDFGLGKQVMDFASGQSRPHIEIHFTVAVTTTLNPLGFLFEVVTADSVDLLTDPIAIANSLSFDSTFFPIEPALGQRFTIPLPQQLEDHATVMKRYLGVIFRTLTSVDPLADVEYSADFYATGVAEFHFCMDSQVGQSRLYNAGAVT